MFWKRISVFWKTGFNPCFARWRYAYRAYKTVGRANEVPPGNTNSTESQARYA